MKKLLNTLLLLLVCSTFALAQTQYEEVVYLKNGSIIHGVIIEQIPNESIKIKSGDNVFVFRMDEVEKITKEEIKPKEEPAKTPSTSDFGYKPKGFSASYEIGVTYISNINSQAMLSLMLVNGYRFSPYFTVGAGIGLEAASANNYMIPVYGDIRVYMSKNKLVPYFNVAAGYNAYTLAYPTSSSYGVQNKIRTTDGYMINPSLGLQVAITQKMAWTVNVGYKYFEVPIYIFNTYTSDKTIGTFHCLTFRTGIAF